MQTKLYIFVRCKDRSCCSEWRSKDLKIFLEKYDMQLFAPEMSTTREGHYNTFLETCIKENPAFGGSNQPSVDENNLGKCQYCPNYSFKSKSAKDRHLGMFHRRKRVHTVAPKSFVCNICQAAFRSLTSLNRHKKNSNHTKRAIAPAEIQPRQSNKHPKKRQRTIQDMLRNAATTTDSSSDEEEVPCAAKKCIVKDESDSKITWISCEQCNRWFHACCIGLGHMSELEFENYNFTCTGCSI